MRKVLVELREAIQGHYGCFFGEMILTWKENKLG